jgi:hypothetical protein
METVPSLASLNPSFVRNIFLLAVTPAVWTLAHIFRQLHNGGAVQLVKHMFGHGVPVRRFEIIAQFGKHGCTAG